MKPTKILKNIGSNKFVIFLLFCFAITLILTAQLTFNYYPDFEGKNVPTWAISKLLFLGATNLLTFGLLFSVIFTSTTVEPEGICNKRDFVWALLCGLLISLFSSFLQPKLYSQQLDLLYAVKLKAPEDKLTVERGIFENQISTMTLFELIDLNTEGESQPTYLDIQKAKKRIVHMLFWPISTIIFYFFGTAFGSRINGLSLTIKIIVITFLILPIWYYSGKILSPVSTIGTFNFILDKLIPELILAGLTILIYKVTNSPLGSRH